ncbi:uncharacterized protein LOC124379186 isoform X2 [Silurus meridionalis]|nr:uncharacterized protein LOC124379186 isoform X2 [Silurus meridionalis]
MATATMAHNHPPQKYYTLGNDVGIVKRLEELIPGLQEVQFLEECDIIFFIWSAFSQARIGIEAAVKILNTLPGNKPAVLVVLHQTFESENVVPDSSKAVNRDNTTTVDCLLNENQELLLCSKNDEALSKMIELIHPVDGLRRTPEQSAAQGQVVHQMLEHPVQKYFTLTFGSPLRHGVQMHMQLQKSILGLQEVQNLEECDFILVFCSAFSRSGTEFEVAVKMLNTIQGNKRAVLVMLHKFDPEHNVPKITTADRRNTTAVNCLFNEDLELMQCSENEESLSTIINWLYPEKSSKMEPSKSQPHAFPNYQMLKCPPIKHFTLTTGETLGQDVSIEKKLQNLIPGLQKVKNLEECDFILVFCPVVSRAGTDIAAALKKLSTPPGNKPAVLVVLHHTFDPEYVAVDSSRAVTRENTVTVDCLFHEDQGLLQCGKNKEALTSVSHWIETRVAPKTKKWTISNLIKPKKF